MKHKIIFFSLIFLFSYASLVAQKPPMPFQDRGACPFECCTYRTWFATKTTLLRSKRDNSSPIIFKVKKGEAVTGVTGVVITTRYGIIKILRKHTIDGVHLRAGATVYLLTYEGEDSYKAWYKGRLISISGSSYFNQKLLRRPKAVWWVKIKNKRGKVGWTNLPENFDNQDQCA